MAAKCSPASPDCSRTSNAMGLSKRSRYDWRALRCSHHCCMSGASTLAAVAAASSAAVGLDDDLRPLASESLLFRLRPLDEDDCDPRLDECNAIGMLRVDPLSLWTRLMWSRRFQLRGNPHPGTARSQPSYVHRYGLSPWPCIACASRSCRRRHAVEENLAFSQESILHRYGFKWESTNLLERNEFESLGVHGERRY